MGGRLRDPQIVEQLTQLRSDVDQLKQAQRIGGDSLLGYLTKSTNLNDFSFTLAPGATRNILITFIPATSNVTAIEQLFLFESYNNADVMNHAALPWADDGSYMITDIQKLQPSGNNSQWFASLSNFDFSSTVTIYLKVIFNGTDTGTWVCPEFA